MGLAQIIKSVFSQAEPRPSAKVARVAALLDCDESAVRRLVRDGKIEAHRNGIRGIRVYLDSVASYQDAQAVVPTLKGGRDVRAKRATASSARTSASLAMLRAAGIVR